MVFSRQTGYTITNNSEGDHYGGHIVEFQVFGPDSPSQKGQPHRALCRLDRDAILESGQSLTQSAVIGVVPTGQLRRGFLHYV